MSDIKVLSDREHILLRPAMYIGSVNESEYNEFILEDNKIEYKPVKYVSGLCKIINEVIDNSIDVAIKNDFNCADKISIKITSDSVEVSDNGTGIPVEKQGDNYLPAICWGSAKSGSNFDDDQHRTQIGMNGIGSYATNCFSKEFIGISDDGKNRYIVNFKDNANFEFEKIIPSNGHTGCTVKFKPDLQRFGLSEISEDTINVIKQRLINLNLCFPKITFKFNGTTIRINQFKKYINLFGDNFELYEKENYSIAFLPNETDEFRHFSYVNGLKISDGGTHVEYLANAIVWRIREKLARRFKDIKPADVKNKLFLIVFIKNFPNPKFNSQAKEKITNSNAEIAEFYGDIDLNRIAKSVMKNDQIMDAITFLYKAKEDAKRRQQMKRLEKPKKIKNDKYYPSVGNAQNLFLSEGDSANTNLMAIFGRKGNAYFALRGKPMNAWSTPQKKFLSNKELSGIYQIIKTVGIKDLQPDGNWYRINGRLVNENDTIKIDGEWYEVKDLIKNNSVTKAIPIPNAKPITQSDITTVQATQTITENINTQVENTDSVESEKQELSDEEW